MRPCLNVILGARDSTVILGMVIAEAVAEAKEIIHTGALNN